VQFLARRVKKLLIAQNKPQYFILAVVSTDPVSMDTLVKPVKVSDDSLQVGVCAGYLCCAGVFDGRRVLELAEHRHNLDGWVLSILRSSGNTVSYGDVPVASCDHTADNGVVHAVNSFVPAVIQRHVVRSSQSRWAVARHAVQTLLRRRLF